MRIIYSLIAVLLVLGAFQLIGSQDAPAHAAAANDNQEALRAYNQAYHEEDPVRGFVRLYLRIAGVVWVTLEWIAAILLYKGYRMLRPHFTRDTSAP